MQGLRKIFRAIAILVLPIVGALIVYGSSNGFEMGLGLFLMLVALGLVATWFW